jgi:uncharacterized protein YbaR (Trm112 family)
MKNPSLLLIREEERERGIGKTSSPSGLWNTGLQTCYVRLLFYQIIKGLPLFLRESPK